MDQLLSTIYGIIITTGLSTMIAYYDGPFGLFYKVRRNRYGKWADCSVCLTPYMALIPLLLLDLNLAQYLTVIGGSVLINRNL